MLSRTSRFRVHAALTSVAILFSANYIISKLAMRSIAPQVFAYQRVVGSAIVLNAIVHEREPLTRRDAWHLAGFALLAIVINQTFFLSGLALTSAHVAAILITILPLFVLAISIVLAASAPRRRRSSASRWRAAVRCWWWPARDSRERRSRWPAIC